MSAELLRFDLIFYLIFKERFVCFVSLVCETRKSYQILFECQ